MAEIRDYLLLRHLRSEPSFYIIRFRGGKMVKAGKGLSFWFLPMSTAVAQVPIDDRELSFVFHGRTSDFQDVTAQGVLTYRMLDPEKVAERVDFTIDLRSGQYLEQPIEKLGLMLTQLAQQFTWGYLAKNPVRMVLCEGHVKIRDAVEAGFRADQGLATMGIELASARISSVKPTADLEKALEAPIREHIQQEADEAAFSRRALAVEKERAIQENELQNRIELAKREEELIGQKGQNQKCEATELSEALRIETEAEAQRSKLKAEATAEAMRQTDGTQITLERERMEIFRELPASVLLGLAAQEFAQKLDNVQIDHLNITPDLVGTVLQDLVQAATRKLETGS